MARIDGLTRLARKVEGGGIRPAVATGVGWVAVVLLTLAVTLLEEPLGRPAQALLLVVPVVGTALLGGRRPAQVVAALATFTFSFALPPVGTPAVRVADDLVALVVFSIVAFSVGTLVARRVDALERVDTQRRALLRSVSHDLRTPLAAIRAAASELETGYHDDASRAGLLDLVVSETERLDRLVANLLGMARIESGALALRRDLVDVGELVERCASRSGRLFAVTPLHVQVAGDLPPVRGDHVLLDQLVTNLLENAVRHGGGADVTVGVALADGRIVLTVADHGPGVPAGEEATIFEAFRSSTNPGTGGVGLAVCRAVAELHGGALSVGPTEGGGATFRASLPVDPAAEWLSR